MFDYKRIQKDCFWDLDISSDDIKNILDCNDSKKLNMLFEKILLNSTALFHDLEIFDKKQLENLLENYRVPRFNSEYAFRRKNGRSLFF
jgi:hypothetical protein